MRRAIAGVAIAALLVVAGTGVASADRDNGTDAFLCPVVGDGVLNAPGRADVVIEPPAGTSFLPGNNQAGVHANANALNENGGPVAGNSPGAEGFTPIWNP